MALETIDVDPTSTGTPKAVVADKIGADYVQVVKMAIGADGALRLIEDADGMPVKIASQPLPAGAATEATLSAMKAVADTIQTASAAIQAAVEALNSKAVALNTNNVGGTVEIANDAGNAIPVSGTVTANISGAVAVTGAFFQATQPVSIAAPVAVTGTFWQGTQPISAAALPLPAGASTEATLSALNAKVPALGQAAAAASLPVVIASNQTDISTVEKALVLTGAAAQTATVNNILENPSGATATTVNNYRSMSVQVVSTATGGTFIFEQSNDGNNWQALPVFNAALVTGVPITAAITATASSIIYLFDSAALSIRSAAYRDDIDWRHCADVFASVD